MYKGTGAGAGKGKGKDSKGKGTKRVIQGQLKDSPSTANALAMTNLATKHGNKTLCLRFNRGQCSNAAQRAGMRAEACRARASLQEHGHRQSKAQRPLPLQCQAPDTPRNVQEEQTLEQQAPPSTAQASSPNSYAESAKDNASSTPTAPACGAQAAPPQVTACHGAVDSTTTVEPMQAVDTATPPASSARQPPRLFLDLFAKVHSPLTNAMLSKGLDCFGLFDFALRETHDILDDRVMHLLLRLAHSGLVGMVWSAPPWKEFSRLKLRRPGPKALRTPEYMDGVPGLSKEEQARVDASAAIHSRSREVLRGVVSATGQAGLEQPPSAMSWLQPDNVAMLREWSAHCSYVAACARGLDIYYTRAGPCARLSRALRSWQALANTLRDPTNA